MSRVVQSPARKRPRHSTSHDARRTYEENVFFCCCRRPSVASRVLCTQHTTHHTTSKIEMTNLHHHHVVTHFTHHNLISRYIISTYLLPRVRTYYLCRYLPYLCKVQGTYGMISYIPFAVLLPERVHVV